MRWPWSERATPPQALRMPPPPLRCDECISEPARIQQLMQAVAQQGATLALVSQGTQTVYARLSGDPAVHNRWTLEALRPGDSLHSPITAVTRLDGIDLAFSSPLKNGGTGPWELGAPDELLYLNMRRFFRTACATAETIAFHTESGLTIRGTLHNLSEQGACVTLSAYAAEHLCASVANVEGRLALTDLSLVLGDMGVRHADHQGDEVQLGVSFRLPEGANLQRLRQALHRRQVQELQAKKATFALPD